MQLWAAQEGLMAQPVGLDKVRTVLIKDEYGNPLILAIQQGAGHVMVVTPQDHNFNEVIEQLGISKRLTVTTAKL